MFINPDDRRIGNRRQQLTRSKIESMLDSERQRRRGMSRFAQTGQDRLARARRSPFRGSTSGGRIANARGAVGRAQFLGAREQGRPDARRYIEPPVVAPPHIQPPTPPGTIPGDPGTQRVNPALLDFLRDMRPGEQVGPAASGADLAGLVGPGRLEPAVSPDILAQILGSGGPTSPVGGAGLGPIAGLVPLGGGTWYDPTSGMLHGAGGSPVALY